MKKILTLCLLQLCLAFAANSTNKTVYRLSHEVIPYNYDLTVVTHLGDMGKFSFSGTVNITIASKEINTQVIKIHAKNLDIPDKLTRIFYTSNTRRKVRIINRKMDKRNDTYVIYLEEPLVQHLKYILSISFAGNLTDSMSGYYRTSYTDIITGETRWLAVTQFQPTEARRAFPCFDEPSFKATFKISLIHMDKYTSVSNMPLLLSKEMYMLNHCGESTFSYNICSAEPGWVKNTFMLTEIMSTYTVAYAVSDFAHLDNKPKKNESLLRTWARPDAINQTIFALDVGPKLLKYYENYFQIPYPLPKLDLFAVPDFILSGMENWGLILFRENKILTDLSLPNALPHSECASIISHEIAHQWFGNLVTMKWWTDIWLNEGFASHMGSKAVNHLFPEWNFLLHDTLHNIQNVLTLDGYVGSHPVHVPISHPDEIYHVFDDISYQKGSILIRMINIMLGEEAFRSGLSNYLNKLSFVNAGKDDLWHHLTVNAHKLGVLSKDTSINKIMDPWLLQKGYPIVTVTRDYKKGTIRLSQRKFLFTQTNKKHKISKYCWNIPITYTSKKTQDFKNTKPTIWLTCKNNNSSFFTEAKKEDWIILNMQLSGLYRVQYDVKNWNLIRNALIQNHTSIDVMNRAQIILDVFDFAWIGNLEYKMALNIITFLRNERNYFPWSIFLQKIQKLYMLTRHLTRNAAFIEYMTYLMQPIYAEWSNFSKEIQFDDLQAPKFQLEIINAACNFQIFDCASKAKQIFIGLMESSPSSTNITSDRLMPVIFCYAIRDGGEKEWNFLWNLYLTSQNTQILEALACTREVTLLKRFLNISLTEGSGIRKQDRAIVFKSIAITNEVGYLVAKDFFMHNIDNLSSLYKSFGFYLECLALPMVTEAQLLEITNFINKNKRYLESSSKQVKAVLDIAKQNIQWFKYRYNGFIGGFY